MSTSETITRTDLANILNEVLPNTSVDYIIDQGAISGTDGKGHYRKWNSGVLEVWYAYNLQLSNYASYNIGGLYQLQVNFSSDLGISFVDTYYSLTHGWNVGSGVAYPAGFQKSTTSATIFANANNTGTQWCNVNVYMCGKWK